MTRFRSVAANPWRTLTEPILLSAYEHAQGRLAEEYIAMLYNMNEVTRQLGAFFQEYDLLLTPTMGIVPPPLGKFHLNRPGTSVLEFMEEAWRLIPYTPLNNYTGTPAISIPLHESKDGLPIGMHFMAAFGQEDLLIRIASALEEAIPRIDRKPVVHVSSS